MNFKCEICQIAIGENEAWLHRRAGHRITNVFATDQLRSRIGELRRLQERARLTGQVGAERLFKGKADALEGVL